MSGVSVKDGVPAKVLVCLKCGLQLSREVAYCPYCGVCQIDNSAPELADHKRADIFHGTENDNIVHALFGRNLEGTEAQIELRDKLSSGSPEAGLPITDHTELAATAVGTETLAGAAEDISTSVQPAAVSNDALRSRVRLIPNWTWVIIGLAFIGIILLSRLPTTPNTTAPVIPSSETLIVNRDDAVVRNSPTASGSEIITKLARGARIAGVWQVGPNNSKWLKMTEGPFQGDYIWEKNLSSTALPVVTQKVDGYLSIAQSSELRDAPDRSATIIEVVKPGLRLYIAYAVTGGWFEIPLSHGGVGYIEPSAFQQ